MTDAALRQSGCHCLPRLIGSQMSIGGPSAISIFGDGVAQPDYLPANTSECAAQVVDLLDYGPTEFRVAWLTLSQVRILHVDHDQSCPLRIETLHAVQPAASCQNAI